MSADEMDKKDEIQVAKAIPEVAAKLSETDDIVEGWFAKHFHNSVISGETAAYNLCHRAKEDLKAMLAKI